MESIFNYKEKKKPIRDWMSLFRIVSRESREIGIKVAVFTIFEAKQRKMSFLGQFCFEPKCVRGEHL